MMRVGGLCAGYGGLEMGLAQVLDCEPAWFCESAEGPSKILAHRYPDVPNHHDLTKTNWATVEPVDIVTAGWPCQPWSNAGKRKGADDERAIWPAIAGAIRVLRPRFVCLENVSAIIAAGELARAVGDLAALGYDAQWTCVRASDVGAPHRRERCFILASDTPDVGYERSWSAREWRTRPADGGGALADAERGGRQRRGPLQLAGSSGDVAGDGADAPDADSASREAQLRRPRPRDERRRESLVHSNTDWGTFAPAIARWEYVTGRAAPNPTEPGPRGGQRLSHVLVEWMMGLPAGWVTGVPGLSRNEQLKALGNGVVPQQAASAFTQLLHIAEVAA